MSNYLTQIDPIGEHDDNYCPYCGSSNTTYNGFCSKQHYKLDNQ